MTAADIFRVPYRPGELAEIVVRLQLEPPPAQPAEVSEPDADLPLLYTPKQTARLLAVSTAKAYELIARGELDSFKIDGSRRVPRAAIERYIQRRSACGDDAA